MSMLDSFFSKGFKAPKCKTLLKLTIPRIKLLRNRKEIQIKQMRKDIAKLLQAGQEATARIRVEHIIREENMMAAQEIIELFCELISVRLPIIETQRECPLDLKEAISSVCFAAPRCADLPELLQVQMLFAAKYGKEFVSAATELVPDCGVNRQLIELLSVRAPAPDVKLKLLKEIAEEHELDWDPEASETEFFKPHEDLLNGPAQLVSDSEVPHPKEKHEESVPSIPDQASVEQLDSDTGFDPLDFPEVPKVMLRSSGSSAHSSTNSDISQPKSPNTAHPKVVQESEQDSEANENIAPVLPLEPDEEVQERYLVSAGENKKFVPFISPPLKSSTSLSVKQSDLRNPVSRTTSEANVVTSPPSLASASFSAGKNSLPNTLSRMKTEVNMNLQDVLTAAQAAADSAERAAAAARSAASLAEVRITELIKSKNGHVTEGVDENPFSGVCDTESVITHKPHMDHQDSLGEPDVVLHSDLPTSHQDHGKKGSESSNHPSYDAPKVQFDSTSLGDHATEHGHTHQQPHRLPSMEDDPYFSYPNLFKFQDSNIETGVHSITNVSKSTHDL